MNLNIGRERIPFYRWRGWPYEGERVRMLLNLAAHVGGYRTMVGAHNTVGCHMHMGGHVVLFGYGRCRYLHILLVPRGM